MGESFSLTQKYRPVTFSEVLDQEAIIKVLKNLLLNNKFSSPLMFTGSFGGGKTTLARIFARAVLCKNLTEQGEPCNKCSSCKAFLEDSNPAYTEIDAASNSSVDDVRKLRENANFKVLGDYDKKVVVIDECHSISPKGNDALLKQLEDNSTDQVYIFCTTAPEKMHKTVRSRCLEFTLSHNTQESISKRLQYICDQESISYEKKSLDTIASLTAPHVRDAVKTLDYLSNFGEITEEVTSEHYKLILENEYLNLVSLLKDNLSNALSILGNIMTQESIPNIYEGIIRNIINTLKLKNKINAFRSEEQKDLAIVITENYKEDLSKILEYLLKRNKYVDQLTLESDIIILNKKLNTAFTEELETEKVFVEVPVKAETAQIKKTEISSPSKQPDASAPVIKPEEKKEEVIERIELAKPKEIEENLEETESILKRYPAYPPHLAMLMAKSRQKSSTVSDKSTVELKERAKDLRKSLPRSEISDFLNKRIKRM